MEKTEEPSDAALLGIPAKRTSQRADRDVQHWVTYNNRPFAVQKSNESVHVRFADEEPGSQTTHTSETSSSEDIPVALDGGYGYFIIFVSFMIHLICDGISFSFGFIYIAVRQKFDISRSFSSAIGSIFLAIPLLCGPYAAMITDMYDCRFVTILGCVLATVGMLGAAFAPNVWVFSLFFSIVGGIGLAFCFNTAIVMVTYYFDKKRAFATGVAVCGSGVGTTVMPIIIQMLLSINFQLTFVLLAAMFLLLTILGWNMRDVEWSSDSPESRKRRFERYRARLNNDEMNRSSYKDPVRIFPSSRKCFSLPAFLNSITANDDIHGSTKSVNHKSNWRDEFGLRSQSVGTFQSGPRKVLPKATTPNFTMILDPALYDDLEHLDLEVGKSPASTLTSRKHPRFHSHTSLSALDLATTTEKVEDDGQTSKISNHGESSSSELSVASPKIKNQMLVLQNNMNGNPLAADVEPLINPRDFDLYQRYSTNDTRKPFNSMAFSRVPASNAYRYRFEQRTNLIDMRNKAPSAPTIYVVKKKKRNAARRLLTKQWVQLIDQLKQQALTLKNAMFSLLLFSVFILYFFYDIPYVNFPEFVHEELNITEDESSKLVSCIGAFNTIFVIFFGAVADRGERHLFLIYGLSIAFAGVSIMMVVLMNTFGQMLMVSSFFGVFIAANYSLASVLTVHILHLSDFQSGYAVLSFVEGIANLFGPPLIGLLRDYLQSYHYLMLIGGGGVVFSGVLVLGMYAFVVYNGFKWKPEHFTDEESEDEEEHDENENKKLPVKSALIKNTHVANGIH